MRAHQLRQFHRFVRIPAALSPVSRGDAHKQRQMLGPFTAHLIYNLKCEPHAIFKAAAILVAALVGKRRKKLVQQVAVSRVYLNKVEASLSCPARCLAERCNHCHDARPIERRGYSVVGRKGDCAGPYRLPATRRSGHQRRPWLKPRRRAGLASRVGQLHARASPLAVHKLGNAAQVGDVLVFPDAQVFRRNAALGGNGRSLKNHQRCAALRAAAQVHQVPVVGKAIHA